MDDAHDDIVVVESWPSTSISPAVPTPSSQTVSPRFSPPSPPAPVSMPETCSSTARGSGAASKPKSAEAANTTWREEPVHLYAPDRLSGLTGTYGYALKSNSMTDNKSTFQNEFRSPPLSPPPPHPLPPSSFFNLPSTTEQTPQQHSHRELPHRNAVTGISTESVRYPSLSCPYTSHGPREAYTTHSRYNYNEPFRGRRHIRKSTSFDVPSTGSSRSSSRSRSRSRSPPRASRDHRQLFSYNPTSNCIGSRAKDFYSNNDHVSRQVDELATSSTMPTLFISDCTHLASLQPCKFRDGHYTDLFARLVPFPSYRKAYITTYDLTRADFNMYALFIRHASQEQWYTWPAADALIRLAASDGIGVAPIPMQQVSRPRPTAQSTPRIAIGAAIREPEKEECRCEHPLMRPVPSKHGLGSSNAGAGAGDRDFGTAGFIEVECHCAAVARAAVAARHITWYSVVQSTQGCAGYGSYGSYNYAANSYSDDAGAHGAAGQRIFKVVRSGSREAAAAQAFYDAGNEGWSTLFTCAVMAGAAVHGEALGFDVAGAVEAPWRKTQGLRHCATFWDLGAEHGEGAVFY